ncbi:DUF1461 domain-containing protein, partial [Candidatus Woesearchaeota archaeon]|nr:DUF1461 domain-containing protein [Candidatus Woesearchaeota archaeon]
MKKEVWLSIIPALLIISFSLIVLINNQDIAQGLVQKHSTADDAVNNTAQLFEYFRSDAEMPGVFDEKEASHLEDVKKVFNAINIVFVLLLISFIAVMPFSNIPSLFLRGGAYALAMLVVCAIIPFNSVFTAMHHVLFPQGNWQFPADSMLIQYYPSGFWNEYYLIAGF